MANTAIWYLGEYTVADGKHEAFKQLIGELVQVEEAQGSDILHYEFFRDDESDQFRAIELFASSEAVLAHLERAGDAVGQILAIAKLTRFEIYGRPTEQLRQALDGFGAKFGVPVCGFSRPVAA